MSRDGSGNFSAGTITGATGLVATTGGLTVSAGGATIAGTTTLSSLGTGVVHSNALGMLSSSLIVDADISASAAIARSKIAAGSPNHVVINDGSGNLSSEANLAVSRGGTGLGALTSGQLLVGAGTSPVTFQAFASSNTPSTIVLRDGSGNFSAGTITANLIGAASNNVLKAGDTMTGALIMNAQNQVRFADADSSNYVAIQSPVTLSSNYTLTLPTTTGTPNQVLTTDGSGELSWSSVQAQNANLTALAALAGTGFVTQTGAGAFAERTILGTANQVIVTNGDGVAGNPILSLPQNINTGASPQFVGLNLSGLTASQAVVTDASKNLASLAYTSSNTPNTIVSRDGSGNFSAGTITGATGLVATTGGLTVSAGGATIAGTTTLSSLGTGVVHSNALGMLSSSLIVDADISASAAIARSKIAAGSPNHVVINDGSGNLSSEANLTVSRGGTGLGALTSGQLLVGAGTSPVTFQAFSSINTPNTIVLRDAGGDFAAGTITAEDGFVATSGGMTITGGAIINNGLTVRRDTTNAAFVVDVNGQSTVFAPLPAATASMLINGNTLVPSLIVRRDSSNAALTVESNGQVSIASPTGV